MKILLISLNAKYIHTSLSLYYLKSYCAGLPHQFVVKEFTINEKALDIIGEIYREKADIVGFSCYIWNIRMTLEICSMLKKVDPQVFVVLGGPEVSYDAEEIMIDHPFIDGIVVGEGEQTFYELIQHKSQGFSFDETRGLVWRKNKDIHKNPPRPLIEKLDDVPFPYTSDDLKGFKNKIVYYESSRGCPFLCQYCLSSTIHGVRYFSLDRVKSDLEKLIQAGVRQVKFVDRTFNCHKNRTKALLSFLLEFKDQNINFHFEIAADLLDEEAISLMGQGPAGFFQVEIGVQSTNPQVLEAIQRKMDFDQVSASVNKLKKAGNVHLHLDLIAGLPHEDMLSFEKSFNQVYALNPHHLQLGFLKLLKGSGLRRQAGEYGFVFQDHPPYEVLETRVLTFDEIMDLKSMENALEQYYNSGKYVHTLTYAVNRYRRDAFAFYRELALFLANKADEKKLGLEKRAKMLLAFLTHIFQKEDREIIFDLMKLDWLVSETKNSLPAWLGGDQGSLTIKFLRDPEMVKRYLPQYQGEKPKDIYKNIIVQKFHHHFSFENGIITNIEKKESIIIIDYFGMKEGKQDLHCYSESTLL